MCGKPAAWPQVGQIWSGCFCRMDVLWGVGFGWVNRWVLEMGAATCCGFLGREKVKWSL